MGRRFILLPLSAAFLMLGCSTTSQPGGTGVTQSTGGQPVGESASPLETGPAGLPTPAPKPISLSGSGSKKTKPFVMFAPARVDLTFSGSGNFISQFTPVSGDALSSVSLSNTIGKTQLTTFVYDRDLNGTKVYANLIASSGEWTIKITPTVPSPATVPASFSGKWGLRTAPVHLSGNFTVTYTHAGRGNFIWGLEPRLRTSVPRTK